MSDDIRKMGTPPTHYIIPGHDIELIDVLRSKMTKQEWEKFCWASAGQYWFRCLSKGDAVADIGKLITYATWLKNSLEETG